MQKVEQMFEQMCSVYRGNKQVDMTQLTCHAPLESTVNAADVQRGTIAHLVVDAATNKPAMRIGLPDFSDANPNAMPLFIVPKGNDFDTAAGSYEYNGSGYTHPENYWQKGTYALVASGSFEIVSSCYDHDETFPPGTLLTSGVGPKNGLLTPTDQPYADIVCGEVSIGISVNPYIFNKDPITNPDAPQVLFFWSFYLPRMPKAAFDVIAAR